MLSLAIRRIPLTAFIVMLCLSAIAQDLNEIQAKTRELDSVHAVQYRQHNKRSTSKPYYPQQSRRRQISASTTPIRPSATNNIQSPNLTVCYDTSGRFFLNNDTITFFPEVSILAKDGKLLVSGQYADWRQPNHFGGFLLKCSDSGTVEWMKTYDTTTNSTYNESWYYRLIELQDGSILMAGHTNDIVTTNDDLLLTRTNSSGDIIWNRAYKSRFWGSGNGSSDYFWIKQIAQDPSDGDIYLTAAHWAQGPNITRFRLTDGDIMWSNQYNIWSVDFHHPFGLDFRDNELIVFSKFNSLIVAVWRLNKTTGDTIATKYLQIIDPSGFAYGFVTTEGVTRLNNGHYAIYGRLHRYFYWPTGSTEPPYHAGVVELDANFNVVRADAYRNDLESNGSNTRITVFPDGSGFYSMLKYISGYTADVYYIQFREGQILRQRRKHYFGEGMPVETMATRMKDGGDMIIKLLGDSINSINKIEFLNLHISDTSSNCLGITSTNNFSTPYPVVPWGYTAGLTILRNDLAPSRNKTFVTPILPMNFLPGCRMVSYCDTLSLIPSQDSFCVRTPVTIVFRRNAACGATPFIRYDTSKVQSLRILNDSTFEFIFKTPGITKVHGSIFGCSLIEDSISLAVFQSPGQLNIGPDSVICPGNTIRLSAKPGYKTYRWQDGSTDSIFTVTQPGDYWVVATDSCGNPFTDTLRVAPHPPIPFDIGPDIRICEKDTVTISAPPSFFNYNWSPDYNIINRFTQTIKAFPQRDTIYHVRAEKTAGCFVYDSIRVFVNAAPPINLGLDQRFCTGDSLVLDAGPGFNQYQWNNGNNSQRITVYNSGIYTVTGITVNGCRSSDSLRILSLYTNPTVNLGNDPVLCIGTRRILDAGNFTNYSWNTGANSKTISIDQTGEYSVRVTDNNGCFGADTILVNKSVVPPTHFLPADTTICNYAKLLVVSSLPYSSYKWNTTQTTPNITISQPGLYWLEVKDRDNCVGRDSIELGSKECLKGFFAPNTFTPNRDGKNDVFRPLIFGPLVKYELSIFNRWGQLVFRSTEYSKGWDGGREPATNGYAWVCSYQFENEKVLVEKGMVMIVR